MPEWTKEPPTEPGWYWYGRVDHRYRPPWSAEVFYIFGPKGKRKVWDMAGEQTPLKDFGRRENAYWLGPITPPEPPVGENTT